MLVNLNIKIHRLVNIKVWTRFNHTNKLKNILINKKRVLWKKDIISTDADSFIETFFKYLQKITNDLLEYEVLKGRLIVEIVYFFQKPTMISTSLMRKNRNKKNNLENSERLLEALNYRD